MTDKQIIQYKKECFEEPYCSLKEVLEELARKEQECGELKQFLSKEPLAIQALQSGYADYKKRSEVFFEMIKQYKQALREIEEIAKPQPYYIDLEQSKSATELEYAYANIVWNLEQKLYDILQKISEVLDE